MAMVTQEKPIVRVTMDGMEAYVTLPTPDDGGVYTAEVLEQELDKRGVRSGIDKQKLKMLASEKLYGQEVAIAWGEKPRDGKDGYYEYHFNRNLDKKPVIRPDGSVDYWSVNSIESVLAGQVLAVYHPPIEGKDGVTVGGKPIPARKGREQLPLKGKGFERKDDNTYVAAIDGKIEMQNDRLVVLPVHELSGNAELSGGNIDFRGDVVIHGGVESGVSIKSAGSITIDGIVEACTLEAGKDIILRSGMLGGNKACVKTKGNITAKFFEFTNVECDGDIQADVLMDCKVNCKGKIIMNGARGSIIGGDVRAIRGIEVTSLGNDAEKKTEITVGASPEAYSRLRVLQKKVQATAENLEQVEAGLHKFEELEKSRGVSYRDDPRRMSLLRAKIRDTATLASDKDEEKKLRQLVECSQGACVSVLRETHPGVIIQIGDLRLNVKNLAKSVEFYKLADKITTRSCYQGVE